MFDSVQGAIMGYALAHGLQYFVFMYFASAKNSAQTGGKPIITMVFIAFEIGMLMTMMEDQSLLARVRPLRWQPQIADGAFGMYLGLVMSHFVIDAGIWRLRDEVSKGIHRLCICLRFQSLEVRPLASGLGDPRHHPPRMVKGKIHVVDATFLAISEHPLL